MIPMVFWIELATVMSPVRWRIATAPQLTKFTYADLTRHPEIENSRAGCHPIALGFAITVTRVPIEVKRF